MDDQTSFFAGLFCCFFCFAFLIPSVALGVTRAQRSGLEIDGLDVMLANA